jgi:mono/diheme cytochrome c family protein
VKRLLLALALAGCGTSIVQPDAGDVAWARERWPDASLESLQRGRALYVQRCSGCHSLRAPAEEPPEKWPDFVAAMVEDQDVRLGADERALIERYLGAASARARRPR